MTVIVELLGGPGCGKSTTAAGLFHILKLEGKSVELVSEWVKKWAWEEKEILPTDQAYIFSKQMKKETDLIGKVDYIITDSPLYLSQYYGDKFSIFNMAPMLDEYLEYTASIGVTRKVFCLGRTKPYDTRGRWTSEANAKKADDDLKELLNSKGIVYEEILLPDEGKPYYIAGELLGVLHGS